MISSIIARLKQTNTDLERTIAEIASCPGVDVGAVIDLRTLPITIESASREEMESTTRWIADREGVETTDVVFVHFEDA